MKNTRLTSILNSSLIACALMIGTLASTQSAFSPEHDPGRSDYSFRLPDHDPDTARWHISNRPRIALSGSVARDLVMREGL